METADIIDAIENALADALAAIDDRWGRDDAEASIERDIDGYTHLSIRPAALNCDGIYEPGFDLVITVGDETYSAVACDLLSPPVQVKRGGEIMRLSDWS